MASRVPTFTVRRATVEDLPTLQRLTAELFESDTAYDPNFNGEWPFQDAGESYLRSLFQDRAMCVIAESGSEAIGFLDAQLQDEGSVVLGVRSEIGQIFVRPRWRRRGVGRALANELLIWSREHGVCPLLRARSGALAPPSSRRALTPSHVRRDERKLVGLRLKRPRKRPPIDT